MGLLDWWCHAKLLLGLLSHSFYANEFHRAGIFCQCNSICMDVYIKYVKSMIIKLNARAYNWLTECALVLLSPIILVFLFSIPISVLTYYTHKRGNLIQILILHKMYKIHARCFDVFVSVVCLNKSVLQGQYNRQSSLSGSSVVC